MAHLAGSICPSFCLDCYALMRRDNDEDMGGHGVPIDPPRATTIGKPAVELVQPIRDTHPDYIKQLQNGYFSLREKYLSTEPPAVSGRAESFQEKTKMLGKETVKYEPPGKASVKGSERHPEAKPGNDVKTGIARRDSVLHLDAGVTLDGKATYTPEGWLRAPALLTKTGIFVYRNPDGTTRRELRLPEEVFKSDTLDSFKLVPITDGHPARPLDANTTRMHQIGTVGESVRSDGGYMKANVLVTDANAVKSIRSGEKVQLSCGYRADVEDQVGIYNGERYDSVQRNIRGNHVALCYVSRGGPDLRLRLDSETNSVVEIEGSPVSQPGSAQHMTTYKIDGVDFEVSETLAMAISKREDDLKARTDSAVAEKDTKKEKWKAEAATQTARADSLEAELKTLKAAASVDVKALVASRIDLERKASKVLKDVKFDSLDDSAIKVAVVEKVRGEKLTRNDSAYVDAAFDFAIANSGALAPKPGGERSVPTAEIRGDSKDPVAASRAARDRMLAESTYKAPGSLTVGAHN